MDFSFFPYHFSFLYLVSPQFYCLHLFSLVIKPRISWILQANSSQFCLFRCYHYTETNSYHHQRCCPSSDSYLEYYYDFGEACFKYYLGCSEEFTAIKESYFTRELFKLSKTSLQMSCEKYYVFKLILLDFSL